MGSKGEFIKSRYIDLKTTQSAIARKADIAVSLLSQIESGDRRITYETARKLAKALKVSWRLLYDEAKGRPAQ